MSVLSAALAGVAATLMSAGAWCDWTRREVPNAVLAALAGLWPSRRGAAQARGRGACRGPWRCGAGGAGTPASCSFLPGWIGGGDGKCGVARPWLGPHDLPLRNSAPGSCSPDSPFRRCGVAPGFRETRDPGRLRLAPSCGPVVRACTTSDHCPPAVNVALADFHPAGGLRRACSPALWRCHRDGGVVGIGPLLSGGVTRCAVCRLPPCRPDTGAEPQAPTVLEVTPISWSPERLVECSPRTLEWRTVKAPSSHGASVQDVVRCGRPRRRGHPGLPKGSPHLGRV